MKLWMKYRKLWKSSREAGESRQAAKMYILNMKAYDAQKDYLKQVYPDEYVVFVDGRLWGRSKNIDELMEKLDEKKVEKDRLMFANTSIHYDCETVII